MAGADVIGTGRAASAESLQSLGKAWPERFKALQLDVLDVAAMDGLTEELATIDVLVNNAGIATTALALETGDDDWARVQATNLDGPRILSQRWAKARIAKARGGAIINVCSILSTRTMLGTSPYSAAKAGLLHLTRSLASEWARHGIRVNALSPGYIETGINRGFFETDTGKAVVKRVPSRRIGQVEDLDGPLLLLASDAGRHLTGSEIVVDGGHAVGSL